MKKFLRNTFFFIVAIFLILTTIAAISLYSLRKSNFYKPSFISNVEQNTFDYIILGSSTGLTTLNTSQIDSITGFTGINLSIDDTSMSSHYLMLEHFIAENKEVKTCVLSINYGDINNANPDLSGNDYRFLPYVSREYVSSYYNSLSKNKDNPLALATNAPFVGVGYYNAEILFPSLISLLKPNKRNRFDERGNYVYPNSKEIKDKKRITSTIRAANPYFKKIQDVCKENSIKLIVYHPPMYNNTVIFNDCTMPFINHSNILKEKPFFYDYTHVNGLGRKKASTIFSESLKQFIP
jgi:hypothetical protein